MYMKKLGFYAYDVGPGKMLTGQKDDVAKGVLGKGSLAETAAAYGHEVVALPPQMRDIAMQRIEELRRCHAVLLGLSSHETEQELTAASMLVEAGVPVVIVEDTWGASLRPKAKNFAQNAAMDIVALPAGIDAARTYGYRNPVHVGPPPHWGQDYEAVMQAGSLRSTLMKKKAGSDTEVPFSSDDKLIYVEGGKGRPVMINGVINAIRDASVDILSDNLIFHFGKHPGERAEKPEEQQLYADAFAERDALLRERNMWLLANTNLTGSQRVGLADVSVFAGGGPTQSITGAYARRPTAYWDVGSKQIIGTQITGASTWFVAELGGMHVIDNADPEKVREALRFLLSPEGQAQLRTRQEAAFPLPEQWECREKIIDLVERL